VVNRSCEDSECASASEALVKLRISSGLEEGCAVGVAICVAIPDRTGQHQLSRSALKGRQDATDRHPSRPHGRYGRDC